MFRYNGFTIYVMDNKVIAVQGNLKFEFESVEKALEILTQ